MRESESERAREREIKISLFIKHQASSKIAPKIFSMPAMYLQVSAPSVMPV